MKKSAFLAIAAFGAGIAVTQAATIIGINFNNGDSAGAQTGTSTFGATWTDVNSAASGTALAVVGTPSAPLAWASSGFWGAGSWTGTNGANSEISTMRAYIDDGDNPAAGAPADLGAVNGDGIGATIRLQGLSAWLAAEGATGYTVTVYTSTDSNPATFQSATARNGGSVTSPAIATTTVPVGGDGTWDGASNDPAGNSNQGFRGSGTFASVFTNDVITLTVPSRSGSVRGTVAAVTLTTVPEPSIALLLGLGGLGLLLRRRK
jgi:hypothetical protein